MRPKRPRSGPIDERTTSIDSTRPPDSVKSKRGVLALGRTALVVGLGWLAGAGWRGKRVWLA